MFPSLKAGAVLTAQRTANASKNIARALTRGKGWGYVNTPKGDESALWRSLEALKPRP